jgi:carboxypeptidase Taq
VNPATWQALEERMRELADLWRTSALLSWDQQTMMPPRGAEGRARATATLRVISHQRLVDPALGELLDEAAADSLDPPRAAMVRVLRRERDQSVRLPDAFVRRLALASSRGQAVWQAARRDRDWKAFQPCIEEMVELKREQADLLGHDGERYDALLDLYEPGMRTERVEGVFAELAAELSELIGAIGAAGPPPEPPFAGASFADAGQWDLTIRMLSDIGFDFDAGLTTRIDEADPFSAFCATLHEAGHGLYDQGFDPDYEDTPIAQAPSLGLHESQSRLWENLVGRSLPFWRRYTPVMHEIFGEAMHGATVDDVYRQVNRVTPSLIRVEADEVTYNMHVLVRFELELALLRGDLAAADLPTAWNDAYRRRLGVTPPHDGDGVLQDVHWSTGAFGYFPTYTIGNLPDVHVQVEAGEFAPLLGWLREKIHRPGYILEGEDLIRHVTGSGLAHAPFMAYLWAKYGELYGVRRRGGTA